MNTSIAETENSVEMTTPRREIIACRETGIIDAVVMRLQAYGHEHELRSVCVGFTSADEGAGVTTLARQIALQAANSGLGKVLLLNANEPKSGWFRRAPKSQVPGLLELPKDELELDPCIAPTEFANLYSANLGGDIVPASVASPLSLKPLFDQLRSQFALVVVDLPPIDSANYGMFLASQCDGVNILVDRSTSRCKRLKNLLAILQEHEVQVFGAILNRYNPNLPNWLQRWL